MKGGEKVVNRVQPVGVTIDKLTVLADLEIHHDEFYKRIEALGFELQEYKSKKYGYSYVYIHKEHGGFIELARQYHGIDVEDVKKRIKHYWTAIKRIKQGEPNTTGMTLTELNTKLEHYQELVGQVDERGKIKRLKDVRYELNPKYFDYSVLAKQAFDEVISMLKGDTLSLSSIHIAIDYNININSIVITDVKSRKENVFKSEDKRLETMYVGKRASRNHLCIYDKKTENEDNESIDQYPEFDNITRFEARLKNNYAKDFFKSDFNPFEGLIVSDDFESALLSDETLTDNEIGKLLLYFRHPHRLQALPETTRKRYQKKMKSVGGLGISVPEDFKDKKNSLIAELENWFNTSFNNSIPDREAK